MHEFFTIFGIVFVSLFAIVANFLYDFFEENLMIEIISPRNKGIWSKINLTALPIIIWGLIELPIFGNYNFLLLSILLNLSVSSAVIYVIKIGAESLFNKTNQMINIIAIALATLIGYAVSYMLLMASKQTQNFFINLLGLIIFLGIYIMIIIKPPKTDFFSGPLEK